MKGCKLLTIAILATSYNLMGEIKTEIDNASFLSEIENSLNPQGSRPLWGLPNIKDIFGKLSFQLSGLNPDALFTEEKIKNFENWLSDAVDIKITVPISLKTLFTEKLAQLIANRPSHKDFTAENEEIPANRISELKPLQERLNNALNSLKSILKNLDGNPLFNPNVYPNKDLDITSIENEIVLINKAIGTLPTIGDSKSVSTPVIEIREAKWGRNKNWKDVTAILRKKLNEQGKQILELSNESVGIASEPRPSKAKKSWQTKLFGSPIKGKNKILKIKYFDGKIEKTITVKQGNPLTLIAVRGAIVTK